MKLTAAQRERRERFGRQLAGWREQMGISQMELALRLERSQSYVSKWETGGTAEFTPEELRAWADALDVPLVDLLVAGDFLSRADVAGGAFQPQTRSEAVHRLASLTRAVNRVVEQWVAGEDIEENEDGQEVPFAGQS